MSNSIERQVCGVSGNETGAAGRREKAQVCGGGFILIGTYQGPGSAGDWPSPGPVPLNHRPLLSLLGPLEPVLLGDGAGFNLLAADGVLALLDGLVEELLEPALLLFARVGQVHFHVPFLRRDA